MRLLQTLIRVVSRLLQQARFRQLFEPLRYLSKRSQRQQDKTVLKGSVLQLLQQSTLSFNNQSPTTQAKQTTHSRTSLKHAKTIKKVYVPKLILIDTTFQQFHPRSRQQT